MRRIFSTFLAGTAIFWGLLDAARADSLTYTLQSVAFADGAVATGSFDFDSASDAVSNVGITLSDAGPANSDTIDEVSGTFQTGQYAYDGLEAIEFDTATDPNPHDPLVLYVEGMFATTPSTQPLVIHASDGSGTFYCDGGCGYITGLPTVSVASLAVAQAPEPSSFTQLGAALALLAIVFSTRQLTCRRSE